MISTFEIADALIPFKKTPFDAQTSKLIIQNTFVSMAFTIDIKRINENNDFIIMKHSNHRSPFSY